MAKGHRLKNFIMIALPLMAFCAAVVIILAALLPVTPLAGQENPQPKNPWVDTAWFADRDGLLLVVDRQAALSRDYVPPDLVALDSLGVPTRPAGLLGRRIVVPALLQMFEDGKKAGHGYYVFSAYRSYDTQAATYKYWVDTLGKTEADRGSALPGHSEHQLGTTFDLCSSDFTGDVWTQFGDAAAGKWLAANAWKYGFAMSYPEGQEAVSGYMYEPWHFRYVGPEVAALVRERGVVPSVFIRELAVLKAAQ